MKDAEQDRIESGKFITFLHGLAGIESQAELSRVTGIPRTEINRLEQGKQKPMPATFERIRAGLGLASRLVDFLRWCHRLIRKAQATAQLLEETPPSELRLPKETRAAAWDIVERALALAQAEHVLLRGTRSPDRASPPGRVEKLFEWLTGHSEAQQRLLIERSRAYRDPLLCLRLCRASEDAAADDPGKALKLAELALFIARRVDLDVASEGFRTRLEGWCMGFVANTQRVIGSDLPATEGTWNRALRLWRIGEDPVGLLSEAYLLDMEASFRRDQGLFPRAQKLHEDALKLARPEEVGIILLNQAVTRKESGDPEGALRSLEQAAQVLDGDQQPRRRLVLRYNQASSLLKLGRASEAVPLVEEVKRLAERIGNEIDLIKTSWLDANCLASQGQKEEALIKLEQVRHEFAARKHPFDYALASLDVAQLYREEGRFAEIKVLAAEILEIFKAQQVHREALAAVILFQEAAEKERVTVELVRQLQDFLAKAKSNPRLRFEG